MAAIRGGVTLAEKKHGGRRPGAGRPRKGPGAAPPTAAVKIDRALASRARMIAADRGVTLSDYLTEVMSATVDRDWGRLVRKTGQED